jgi:hypothetical protein
VFREVELKHSFCWKEKWTMVLPQINSLFKLLLKWCITFLIGIRIFWILFMVKGLSSEHHYTTTKVAIEKDFILWVKLNLCYVRLLKITLHKRLWKPTAHINWFYFLAILFFQSWEPLAPYSSCQERVNCHFPSRN